MRADPVWAEIAASKVIKEKAAQTGSDSIQLATGGTPLTVQNPYNRQTRSQAAYKDKPVPVSELQKVQAATGVSDNVINTFAEALRSWFGNKAVEANFRLQLREKSHELGDHFSVLNWPMDSYKKTEREQGGRVDRDIVYVNDIDEFVDTLKSKRGYSSRTNCFLKIGIDGGSSSVKITLNITKIDDDFSSPPNRSRGLDLSGGFKPTMFKESGVKRVQIICFVEKVSESNFNLRTLWHLVDLNILFDTHGKGKVTLAADYKVGSSVMGIGQASSSFPCPYCDMPSCQFIKDSNCTGGNLRTLGEIRALAAEYQEDASKSTAAKKLSSAKWKSCETQPLPSSLPDDTFVLDIYPPPPLHTKLGVVNGLFDVLDRILVAKGYEIRAENWSGPLNCTRGQYHGGQFVGNYCDKLLANLDKLESLLSQAAALNNCLPVLEAFKAFAKVHKACFQMSLEPSYKRDIQVFADAYIELAMYCRTLKVKCSEESIKIHSTMVHVRQFLERDNRLKAMSMD